MGVDVNGNNVMEGDANNRSKCVHIHHALMMIMKTNVGMY